MSSDEVIKAELAYLRAQIVALWKAIAAVQDAIAKIHQRRVEELLASEPRTDAEKLN
jgi:hypothetical protein